MQTKEHSLCFTGHRSEKLPKTEQEMEHLKRKLLAEIDNAIENGIDTFYMGACYGFDLLAAQMVLRRKKVISLNEPRQKPLKLVAVIPFEEQASRWSEKDRELYFDYTAKITVYPVGAVGFYLPSILHTEDGIKIVGSKICPLF